MNESNVYKNLATILHKAQGVVDIETEKAIDIGGEVVEIKHEFQQLKQRERKLMAQVERLKWALNEYGEDDEEVNTYLNETPQQSIAHIKAEAVHEFVEWYKKNHGIANGQVTFASKKFVDQLEKDAK